MFTLYVVFIIIASLLLILLCLLQNSKRDNVSGNIIGGSGFDQAIGVKKTSDILENSTLILFFIIIVLCVLSYKDVKKDKINASIVLEKMKQQKEIEDKNKAILEDTPKLTQKEENK